MATQQLVDLDFYHGPIFKLCQMDFWSTKDEAHEWVLQIGVVFMSVVIMVSALDARNNQKKERKKKKTKRAILAVSVLDVRMIPR